MESQQMESQLPWESKPAASDLLLPPPVPFMVVTVEETISGETYQKNFKFNPEASYFTYWSGEYFPPRPVKFGGAGGIVVVKADNTTSEETASVRNARVTVNGAEYFAKSDKWESGTQLEIHDSKDWGDSPDQPFWYTFDPYKRKTDAQPEPLWANFNVVFTGTVLVGGLWRAIRQDVHYSGTVFQ